MSFLNDGPIAESGDILLARVGRNLETKVCMVKKGYAKVSDCIFILRVHPELRRQVFDFLISEVGQRSLSSAAHGVAAKFITSDALMNIRMNYV